MNLIEHIQQSFYLFLQKEFNLPIDTVEKISFQLNLDTSKKQFGDLTSNAALVLAKELGQSPSDIAQRIQASFSDTGIKAIEIAGPGFLNFFLTLDSYKRLALELCQEKETFFKPLLTQPKNYSLEFVSANPTGPLHLGHGRGGIIGDVLGNILQFLGHKATKEFYINDAGAQMHKLGVSLKIRCQQELGEDVQLPEQSYHGEYLIPLAKEYIKSYGKDGLDKPISFFADFAEEFLLRKIKSTTATYGIHFDVWFSEKTLHENDAIQKELEKLSRLGKTYEQDGALWFKSTEYGDDKDRVLRKKDGELTYVSADIAYLENKIHRGFDQLIMILGQDHHSYVVRLKGILQALDYNPAMLDVILYQLVTIKESGALIRMSKRKGNIVTLEDVINTVGADVARFFYLNRKADAHLEFDIDLAMKKTDENPVYYIQYAYVRTGSILDKAKEIPGLSELNVEDLKHISEAEDMLIKKIVSLKELLNNIGEHYQTHLLTYYVIELAHLFHKYYNDHRVIDLDNSNRSKARLLMVEQLRHTFGLVLGLLGISKPLKM